MKMMVKKLLGDLVKEERLRRNLSQNALAENVHVSLRTISDIENYNANMPILIRNFTFVNSLK
jgi:transcriptional regulator with XRE-family HTH domain